MLKSRTYIPKLLNFRYITLAITNIYIKYHAYKISIFEIYKSESNIVHNL